MIYKSLNRNYLFTAILFPLFALLIWGKTLFTAGSGHSIDHLSGMPAYNYIAKITGVVQLSVFSEILGLIFLLIIALLLIVFNQNYRLINKRTAIPGVFFILMLSGFSEFHSLSPGYFGAIALFLGLSSILDFHKKDSAINQVLEAAFYLSVGSLFYFPTLMFLPVLWYGLLTMRPLYWREWVISIIGVILPWFIMFAIYFGFEIENTLSFENLSVFKPYKNIVLSNITISEYSLAGYLTLLILFSFFNVKRIYTSIKLRKYFGTIIFTTFWSVLVLVTTSINTFVMFAVPASFMLANYFDVFKRETLREIVFFVLLAAIFINNYVF